MPAVTIVYWRDIPAQVIVGGFGLAALAQGAASALAVDGSAPALDLARAGAEAWLDGDYSIMNFAPARLTLKPGEGPPHIRLDRAAEFLLGDRL